MVGGGVLVKTLIGINYETSVVIVGVLMLSYVLFGGMVATTWVQIIKAVLLVAASLVIVALVWAPYGFSLPGFLQDVVVGPEGAGAGGYAARRSRQDHVGGGARAAIPRAGSVLQGTDRSDQPGYGAGVRNRGSAAHPDAFLHRAQRAAGAQIRGVGDGHHWRLLLAHAVLRLRCGQNCRAGRHCRVSMPVATWRRRCWRSTWAAAPIRFVGNFMLAFVSAVAFATIVAVVAGLVLASASAMAHDLYVGVWRAGKTVTPQGQVKAARVATIIVGALCDRHRHRGKGSECRRSGGPRLRRCRQRQFPLRAPDAALEALQYRRHRGRHADRHHCGGGPDAGFAEPYLPESGEGSRSQGSGRGPCQARGRHRSAHFDRRGRRRQGEKGSRRARQGRDQGQYAISAKWANDDNLVHGS